MAETTLYDVNENPVAYIADDGENSIYLWSGHAVSYINDENIHGWNGQHLGCFADGIVYDLQGTRVGFTRKRCPVATYAEPAKYVKYAKYVRYARYAPYARPALSVGYSNQSLESFLQSGAV